MTDAELRACTASAWEGEPRSCRWCNGELTGRRQRWCSDKCVDEFGQNHWWNAASAAAKRRDQYRCQDCPAPGWEAHHTTPLHTLTIEALTTRAPWRERRPVKHSDSGCHHHQDGLVTLCVPCHGKRHRKTPATSFDQLSFLRKVRAL